MNHSEAVLKLHRIASLIGSCSLVALAAVLLYADPGSAGSPWVQYGNFSVGSNVLCEGPQPICVDRLQRGNVTQLEAFRTACEFEAHYLPGWEVSTLSGHEVDFVSEEVVSYVRPLSQLDSPFLFLPIRRCSSFTNSTQPFPIVVECQVGRPCPQAQQTLWGCFVAGRPVQQPPVLCPPGRPNCVIHSQP